MSLRNLLAALGAIASLSIGACGSDDEEHEEHQQPAECVPITEACHDVDTGEPGPIHDCHETAHDGTAADCQAVASSCISLCEAALADAGLDGGGDGGH